MFVLNLMFFIYKEIQKRGNNMSTVLVCNLLRFTLIFCIFFEPIFFIYTTKKGSKRNENLFRV